MIITNKNVNNVLGWRKCHPYRAGVASSCSLQAISLGRPRNTRSVIDHDRRFCDTPSVLAAAACSKTSEAISARRFSQASLGPAVVMRADHPSAMRVPRSSSALMSGPDPTQARVEMYGHREERVRHQVSFDISGGEVGQTLRPARLAPTRQPTIPEFVICPALYRACHERPVKLILERRLTLGPAQNHGRRARHAPTPLSKSALQARAACPAF